MRHALDAGRIAEAEAEALRATLAAAHGADFELIAPLCRWQREQAAWSPPSPGMAPTSTDPAGR